MLGQSSCGIEPTDQWDVNSGRPAVKEWNIANAWKHQIDWVVLLQGSGVRFTEQFWKIYPV